ncbi:H(+)/Cl(-) exchange transporter 3 [Schistosoma japonicum]|uniref:Chloride channel protein n=2 Tax=Schistosoma japonicum TaxID=6182 RepID=A0A4Z2DNP0_SCHJA|nr:H(+)/Cl(-) exchange transporter 3 [Schistosoma japonicum]
MFSSSDTLNPFADPTTTLNTSSQHPHQITNNIAGLTSSSPFNENYGNQSKVIDEKVSILNDEMFTENSNVNFGSFNAAGGATDSRNFPFQSSFLNLTKGRSNDFLPYQNVNSGHSKLSAGTVSSVEHYEDFETIDWVKDVSRDRCRHRELHLNRKICCGSIKACWDSASGWFCVLCVGLLTGFIACIVDIGCTWMSDLKEGVCLDAFWFNREQCCWSSSQADDVCDQWYSWSRLFMNKDPTGEYPDAYFVGYLFYIIYAVLFALVCVFLVRMFAPYACGSGIPEIKTILGGFIIRGYLGKWTLLIKSVGMILGVGAGLNLGKEGPMVHMAACVGNIFAHFFPKYGQNEAKKREILSASAAAGVAVAFGAPIGGVLFSLEEASYYFPMKTMFRSFFCAMVSANVLRILNPYGSDNMIMFYVDYQAQWHVMELIPFALLGLLGGIFGTIFNRANLYICRLRKTTWLGQYPVREVLVVALITAVLSFPHTYLRMNTSELIKLLVSRCSPGSDFSLCDYHYNTSNPVTKVYQNYPAGPTLSTAMVLLAIALVLKLILTVFTFGIKVPTGLFIPSLAAGAIMGRMLGIATEQLVVAHASHPFIAKMCKSSQPCINPGLYAMVGAAATLGGVTRMTISLVVVMLELTGGLNYIIPLMIAAMVSKWTGDRLTNGSIYEEHIRLNDYPYLGAYDELDNMLVAADVMHPRRDSSSPLYVVTQYDMTVGDLDQLVSKCDVKGFPVVVSHDTPYLVGWVSRRELRWALDRERKYDSNIIDDSPVYFATIQHMHADDNHELTSVNLQNIIDWSPTTVSDHTPMETVLDFFRKLGLRQIIVTRNGCPLGILTKKDILRHVRHHNPTNR